MRCVIDATELARAVVRRWRAIGVEHVVLCPGSRSAPLAFAAHAAAQRGELTLHTRIDERTAAFLALGAAKASGRPAVVFTTSGTAAANLHPAVLEAAHAAVPLLAVTADRPASLRGTNANQTTDQVGMFGSACTTVDVSRPEDLVGLTVVGGPSHLNVQFEAPLVPNPAGFDADLATAPEALADAGQPPNPTVLQPGRRTVVVAGDNAGPPARTLAEAANWPLFAEPSSGSRTGANVIATYRLLLDTELGGQIQRVVVFGHPTLSRPVTRLLSRPGLEVVSVPAAGRWAARPHPVSLAAPGLRVEQPDDPTWLSQWHELDQAITQRLEALVLGELGPHAVAREVSLGVPPGGMLYVGASNPIRDLDLMAVSPPPGQHRKVLANRGLAGIDGTLSSAIGAALTRPGRRNLALVGDVTFLHDLTGLVIGPEEQRPDLTIVVVNDNGGSIFAVLEQGAPEYASSFDRLFAIPHGLDLGAVCAALHVPHWRVHSIAELRHALTVPNGGIDVIEAVCRRDQRRELDEQIRSLSAPD